MRGRWFRRDLWEGGDGRGGGSGWCEGGGLGGTRGREVMEGRGGGEFFWVGLVGDLLLPCE